MTSDLSVHRIIAQRAAQTPEAQAIAAPGRGPLSYGALWAHVEETAGVLRTSGLGRGDAVAIVLPNGPEMVAAFLAVASCATSAPLNPTYSEREFDFYLSDLDAKALLVQAGDDSPALEVARTRGIPVLRLHPQTEGAAGLFTLEGEPVGPAREEGLAESADVALVLHTSGTTSRPKMVPLSHTNLCTSAYNIATTLRLGEADRCLNVMPLFHIHGLMAAVLASMAAGASIVCTPGFYATQFFDWMQACRPTWYTAVPTMHQAILARAESHREVIESRPLRFIRSSSASLPPQVLAALEATFGAPVVEAYGMTEAAHQMTSNPLPPGARKPGSVGPAAGPEVAIMDERGTLLPGGATGEVAIHGRNVTRGYTANPDANHQAFTDGWFRTGDQGYLDEDGYLFLTGRLKEMINRAGENIAPREVDEVLLEHTDVVQAVAFAVPDSRLGEGVAAAVILAQGATVTELQLREFAATRLAPFKVPERIVFLDEIPKGPTGKLQRIGLAERLGVTALEAEGADDALPFTPPRTTLESVLADIWTEVLNLDRLSVHDRFLNVGGDSMLATRLVARVRERLELELSLIEFFDAPTVADQAPILEGLILAKMVPQVDSPVEPKPPRKESRP